MEYNFRDIEKKWQKTWKEQKVYHVPNESQKPKHYVLDMFPYPSGAGLHVGHPLGYIASDIYARYKRLKGFNVLHPMGYDAFGLPAEQYAIEHGVHPAVSTEKNIETFRRQLDNIGFSFDWSREIRTSDPKYYKWTQWIFLQLFKSWYNRKKNRTESINDLIKIFEEEGNVNHPIPNSDFKIADVAGNTFTAEQWKNFDKKTQQTILMEYRIAYCGYGEVNWCEALGTVLANDEVVNGVSERGGYPVEKKKLRQWYLRITEYAERLLEGLQKVEFSEAMKEMQSNWIGKSIGAEVRFDLIPGPSPQVEKGEDLTSFHSTSGEGEKKGAANVPKYSVRDRLEFENARRLRKEKTEAEDLLWQYLRNNQLGEKFRRQHPIDGFIADFICLQKKIVVEVDGGYHQTDEQQVADAARTATLNEIGFKVLRFTNDEVLFSTETVLQEIKLQLQEIDSPSPPLEKGQGVEVNSPSPPVEKGQGVEVYTTRPDTIFGVDFMVLAPEHELVEQITTPEQKQAVDDYIVYVKSRTERDRISERNISGVFTGAYAEHPFNDRQIPIWISEYVLAGYGTGAIMGVPSGDERDHKFAQHFNIPITNIFGESYKGTEAITDKNSSLYNSDFLNGMSYEQAFEVVLSHLEVQGTGRRKINYKMRDAAFSRQRYWGEPFPIIWKDGIAYPLDENELPLELPYVENYKPGPEGEGPLANIPDWVHQQVKLDTSESSKVLPLGEDLGGALETNTMPGYAGSSWYFLRYMDPHNNEQFCDKKISDYWNQVDLYVGGTEHAVGHLLYSRMWTKALYDLGFISFDEPFKKLLNQGMIQGSSRFVLRYQLTHEENNNIKIVATRYVSTDLEKVDLVSFTGLSRVEKVKEAFFQDEDLTHQPVNGWGASWLRVDVNFVDGLELDIEAFKKWRPEFHDAKFVLSNGKYICRMEVEKMSKSKFNTVNPDTVVDKYGADTFRMYEMFLGPIDQSKPWDTKGIEGVHRFLKKLWRLFFDDTAFIVTNEKANQQELKVLHKTIKKIEEDTERFSFNTAVSSFMICVNELTDMKCHKKEILFPLITLLQPYAPHVTEELYTFLEPEKALPNGEGLGGATFPHLEESFLVETTKEYPISINGKLRTQINIHLNASQQEVQDIVMADPIVQKWIEGKPVKKVIYVKGKMVNVVV